MAFKVKIAADSSTLNVAVEWIGEGEFGAADPFLKNLRPCYQVKPFRPV